VSHSICTLEFEVHRPLYDWIVDNLPVPQPRPHQYEFAKLIPNYMVVSSGSSSAGEGGFGDWLGRSAHAYDRGMRRRGVTPKPFALSPIGVGVSRKFNS
jgi:glutaminyl-tRNA synthetase